MIKLSDYGGTLRLHAEYVSCDYMDIEVHMVIKAPKGIIALFGNRDYINLDAQREAIRAFVGQHREAS